MIHNAIKNALLRDGWRITADPFTIRFEDELLYADMSAEKPLVAERGEKKNCG